MIRCNNKTIFLFFLYRYVKICKKKTQSLYGFTNTRNKYKFFSLNHNNDLNCIEDKHLKKKQENNTLKKRTVEIHID